MDQWEIERRIGVALADADPIGTDLGPEDRLEEYSMRASEIAKRVAGGEDIDRTIAAVFSETCGHELSRAKVREIVEGFEAGSDRPND